MNKLALLSGFALVLAAMTGCTTTVEQEEGSAGDDPAAQAVSSSCGTANYNEAFKHYRKAVYGAKDRLAGKTCEDNTFLWGIADEGAQAVMTCAAFKDVIKTSPYAEPLRKVLAQSLSLKSLTGELLVLRDSQFANWSSVEAFFPGTVMSTEPQGALGAHTRFEFGANGKASRVELTWGGANLDQPVELRTDATYRLEKTGAEKAPRRVIIEHGGKTEKFDLKVHSTQPGNYSSAPVFQLVGEGANASELWTTYNSLVGECDA